MHPKQDELVGVVDKNQDGIHWGSLKSLDAFGILPVKRFPTPQVAITRQEFERRLEEAGTKICFGKGGKLMILLGLPKSLYFRLDVDAKPVPSTEFTAYQDLSESEKADIWKRMVETRLDRVTHPIISSQGGIRAPQAKP